MEMLFIYFMHSHSLQLFPFLQLPSSLAWREAVVINECSFPHIIFFFFFFKPTAPGIAKRSPIQVLPRPNPA